MVGSPGAGSDCHHAAQSVACVAPLEAAAQREVVSGLSSDLDANTTSEGVQTAGDHAAGAGKSWAPASGIGRDRFIALDLQIHARDVQTTSLQQKRGATEKEQGRDGKAAGEQGRDGKAANQSTLVELTTESEASRPPQLREPSPLTKTTAVPSSRISCESNRCDQHCKNAQGCPKAEESGPWLGNQQFGAGENAPSVHRTSGSSASVTTRPTTGMNKTLELRRARQ